MSKRSVSTSALNNLPSLIREAGQALSSDRSQKAAWRFISLLQRAAAEELPLYVPMLYAQSSNPDTIDPLDLQLYILPDRDLYQKVELEDGGAAYAAFLSRPDVDEGPPVEYEAVPAGELFSVAFNDPQTPRIIIDPWHLSAMLTHELLSLILNVDGNSAQSSLFIAQGETIRQHVDVAVSVADHPFDAIEPGPKAVYAAAGHQLVAITSKIPEPAPGQIAMTDACVDNAAVIFHVSLPKEISEDSLKALIDDILSLAERMGYTSIALPAIGNEEAPIERLTPFALLAASGWLSRHPNAGLAITITVRSPELCKVFAASANTFSS